MSATTVGSRPAPPQGRGVGQGSAGPVLRRRFSKARLLLAVGLVLVCALAGVMVAQRVDVRVPVLAAARAIGAGQTVTAADVMTVKVAVEAGVATVPASQLSTVVGQVAAVPLVAGTLLSPASSPVRCGRVRVRRSSRCRSSRAGCPLVCLRGRG